MNNQVLYVLLTYSGSLLSRCIKLYTKEPYTHVSIALDINLNELYSFGRIHPYNPLFGGFVRENIVNGTYARFENTRFALYSLKVNDIQYRKLKKEIYKFKLNQEKYGYNLVGLFGVVLNVPVERKYNYFCSQFVATILKNSGINIIDKPTALITPRDFRKCEKLELVYEGILKSYRTKSYSYATKSYSKAY